MEDQRPEPIKTKFSEAFGIPYPIVAAPMFLVSNEQMVVATGQAGGLGAFPALNFRPMGEFRAVVERISSSGCGPFGVNIIVQSKNKTQHEQLDICIENKVPLIITSLGNPKHVIDRAHQAGTQVYCDVIGTEHATKALQLGADGLVAVGSGAGGHAGETSLFALIPALRKLTDKPILAAGSIGGGAGLLAALSLGASGAYMGTRFIASVESPASREYKDAILQAEASDIVSTHRVDGFPGNFILTDRLKELGVENSLWESVISRSQKLKRTLALLRAAKLMKPPKSQSISYKTIFSAGHGVSLIKELCTCEEIVYQTVNEYHRLRSQLP